MKRIFQTKFQKIFKNYSANFSISQQTNIHKLHFYTPQKNSSTSQIIASPKIISTYFPTSIKTQVERKSSNRKNNSDSFSVETIISDFVLPLVAILFTLCLFHGRFSLFSLFYDFGSFIHEFLFSI